MTRTSFVCLMIILGSLFAQAYELEGDTATWNRDPLGLETVVVTATRTPKTLLNVPVVTRVITADDIRKTDATDVRDVLRQEIPGLEFTYSMLQQVLNMGGYDGNNILFLVDGERMAGESVDNVDYARLDMANIERIEIVKGAASTLYGSAAMGGVINIITKKPTEKWMAGVGSRYEGASKEWRHNGSLGFSSGRWNSLTSFQMTDADSLSLKGDEPSAIKAYGGRTRQVKERLIYNVSDRLTLSGRASYFFRERNTSDETHERYRDLWLGAKANWTIDDSQNLEVAYSFDQYDKSDYTLRTSLDVRDYSNRQASVRSLYNLSLPSLHSTLTAGGDFMRDYLLSYQFADDNKSHTQNSMDVYAQWDYTPNAHWSLIGGMRYDYFSASRSGHPTWKLAAMYKVDAHSFRLSYATGFRAPSLKERYMNFFMGGIFMIYGNIDLKSETNHNLSASWEHHGAMGDKMKYSVTTTAFYNFFRNYITTATIMDGGRSGLKYTNVANQRIAGVDASVQLHHQNGLGARLSGSYVRNSSRDNQPDLTAARPLSLTWRLDYDHEFSSNYSVSAALSGRFLSSINVAEYATLQLQPDKLISTHYPHYALWKFAFSQHVWKHITINTAIDNLFDYRPTTYYANSPITIGRTFTIGLKYDF